MKDGFTLVEALVAILLVALIGNAVGVVVSMQSRASLRIRDDVEAMEVGRTVRVVLEAELRHGLPGRDWHSPAGDTVALRAFRGLAIICGPGADPAQLLVQYRGVRQPNPAKDSALVLLDTGYWETRALERVEGSTGSCHDGGALGEVELWTLDRPTAGGVFLRLFERGSYHLADGAFRYRSGESGRQPLTAERVDDSRSGLEAMPGGFGLELHLMGGAGSAAMGPLSESAPPPERWRFWSVQPTP